MAFVEQNHADILDAANQVKSKKTDVEGKLGSLRRKVVDLEPYWQGQSGSTFQEVMFRWDQDSKKLMDALGEIAVLLEQAAGTTEAADAQVKNSVNFDHITTH